jgi:hypothetical protein
MNRKASPQRRKGAKFAKETQFALRIRLLSSASDEGFARFVLVCLCGEQELSA